MAFFLRSIVILQNLFWSFLNEYQMHEVQFSKHSSSSRWIVEPLQVKYTVTPLTWTYVSTIPTRTHNHSPLLVSILTFAFLITGLLIVSYPILQNSKSQWPRLKLKKLVMYNNRLTTNVAHPIIQYKIIICSPKIITSSLRICQVTQIQSLYVEYTSFSACATQGYFPQLGSRSQDGIHSSC